MKTILMLTLVLAVSCSSAISGSKAEPVRIIFDTDMGNDIDDALALGMLHALENRGESKLLATTSSKDHPKSTVLLDAINTFYGRPDIPIGIVSSGETKEEGRFLKIVDRQDSRGFHFPRTGQSATDAVSLMRATLAQQPNKSVVIVQVGFFTNLKHLLESKADKYSDLNGIELVKKKVRLLSLMAGTFQTIRDENRAIEWNVLIDIPSAQFVAKNWPSDIVWSGEEVGSAAPFPAISIEQDFNYVQHHPLKEGYLLYKKMPHNRPTWDLTSVLYAVRPNRDYFELSMPGKVTVEDDGFTRFERDAKGRDRYLKLDTSRVKRLTEALVLLASEPPKVQP